MTHYYALHTIGIPVSEENLRQIPQPRLEVIAHITFRMSQALGVLAAMGGLAYSKYTGEKLDNLDSIASTVAKYASYGCTTGAAIGPVLGLSYLCNCSYDSIHDRAYRLRFSKSQVRVDRLTLLAAAAAAAASFPQGEPLLTRAALGIVGGTLFSAVLGTVIGLF